MKGEKSNICTGFLKLEKCGKFWKIAKPYTKFAIQNSIFSADNNIFDLTSAELKIVRPRQPEFRSKTFPKKGTFY